MTAHTHRTLVDGCYRCDLNRDAVNADLLDDLFPPEITALLVASGYSVLGWVDLNRLNLDKPKEATT